MSPRLAKGIVVFAILAQVGGVYGLSCAPDAVFANIADDAMARFGLRLTAWAHAAYAALALSLLPTADRTVVRKIAAASALYHVLAGIEAWGALHAVDIVLAEPRFGPIVLHGSLVSMLVPVAVWPSRP